MLYFLLISLISMYHILQGICINGNNYQATLTITFEILAKEQKKILLYKCEELVSHAHWII